MKLFCKASKVLYQNFAEKSSAYAQKGKNMNFKDNIDALEQEYKGVRANLF